MKIKELLTFIKLRIAVSVAISSALGYVLSTKYIGIEILYLLIGVFLLASGSGALNQVQEWRLDEKMNRTRNRPIPRRIISPTFGFVVSTLLISFGIGVLAFGSQSILVPILGASAVVIYNGIYTPLKRISPFAAIPGAFIGAIPPMIGWVMGGNEIQHPLNLALSLFFFIWQIPHFWLLLIVYEDDYRLAGFPVLTDKVSPLQLSRISFSWIVALVLCSFWIISLLDHISWFTLCAIVLLGLFLLARTHKMVTVLQPRGFYRFAFVNLNIFVLFISFILTFNKLLNI